MLAWDDAPCREVFFGILEYRICGKSPARSIGHLKINSYPSFVVWGIAGKVS